jgi:hypothetical protein
LPGVPQILKRFIDVIFSGFFIYVAVQPPHYFSKNIRFANIVEDADILVIECGSGYRFTAKPLQRLSISGDIVG